MLLDPQAYTVLQSPPGLVLLQSALCLSGRLRGQATAAVRRCLPAAWRTETETMHFDELLCLFREAVGKCVLLASAQTILSWFSLDQRHKVDGCSAFLPRRGTSIIGG